MPLGASKHGTLFEKMQTVRYLSRTDDKQAENMLTVVAMCFMTNRLDHYPIFGIPRLYWSGVSVSSIVPYILYDRSLGLLARARHDKPMF